MERWEAERITKFPRWTGYLAVAIYGPLTISVMALEALEGGEAYGETGFLVLMGWGLFGVLAGLWMVWAHDKSTECLRNGRKA